MVCAQLSSMGHLGQVIEMAFLIPVNGINKIRMSTMQRHNLDWESRYQHIIPKNIHLLNILSKHKTVIDLKFMVIKSGRKFNFLLL